MAVKCLVDGCAGEADRWSNYCKWHRPDSSLLETKVRDMDFNQSGDDPLEMGVKHGLPVHCDDDD